MTAIAYMHQLLAQGIDVRIRSSKAPGKAQLTLVLFPIIKTKGIPIDDIMDDSAFVAHLKELSDQLPQ